MKITGLVWLIVVCLLEMGYIQSVSALQCYSCRSDLNPFCEEWDVYADYEENQEQCVLDADTDDFPVEDFRCSFMTIKVGLRNEKTVHVRGCNFKGLCPVMGLYNLSPTRNFTIIDCYTCASSFCNKKKIPDRV